MNRYPLSILFPLIGMLGLLSCQSTYLVSVETQTPPAFVLPEKITGLLVVNNAVPQPADRVMNTDSVPGRVVETVAETFSESNFYEQVSIYEQALREDEEWLAVFPLTEADCRSLYEESGHNAILSIDRLLFDIRQSVPSGPANVENYFRGPIPSHPELKCRAVLSSSIYCKGKKVPLAAFTLRDSLSFSFTMDSDSTAILRELSNYAVDALTDVIAQRLAHLFIPKWESSDRLIYSSPTNARMSEAMKYFDHKKWGPARAIWLTEYDKGAEKEKAKARLAMNIGLSFEMEDRLETAVLWVQKARGHYETLGPDKMKKEKERVEEYLSLLHSRIQNNRILDIQFQ